MLVLHALFVTGVMTDPPTHWEAAFRSELAVDRRRNRAHGRLIKTYRARRLFECCAANGCMQRRFTRVDRLPLPWWEPASLSPGSRAVSIGSALFWHATGSTPSVSGNVQG